VKPLAVKTKTMVPMSALEIGSNPHLWRAVMVVSLKHLHRTLAGYSKSDYSYGCNCEYDCDKDYECDK
jgi:hypothetical protein